jgi:hypothetical protein
MNAAHDGQDRPANPLRSGPPRKRRKGNHQKRHLSNATKICDRCWKAVVRIARRRRRIPLPVAILGTIVCPLSGTQHP